MTSPGKSRHAEVKDGDQTVAAAGVTAVEHAEGTVPTSLHPSSGHTPRAAGPAWSMRSWICPGCKPARAWRLPSRSATPNRWSACGSGPKTPSPARPGRPPWSMRTYRPEPRREPAGILAVRHPPRDIATWVKDPGGHQGRYVGMELRSLASGTAPAGASRPRPACPLRGCLSHCRAQRQGPVPGRQAGPQLPCPVQPPCSPGR
jgi:hypothetical protein